MSNNKTLGDDSNIKINKLTKELEFQMKNLHDESSVKEIRRIVGELDKLSPLHDSGCFYDDLSNLKKGFYHDALKDREFISSFTSKKISIKKQLININKIRVATILIFVFIIISTSLTIGGLGFLKPLIQQSEDTINKKFNTVDDNNFQSHRYNSYEEVEKAFSTIILKPTQLPVGYKLKDINAIDISIFTSIIISYQNEKNLENEISYTIKIQKSNDVSYEEKIQVSPDYQKDYVSNGLEFNLFKNNFKYGCTFDWMNINYLASGFENEKELINFIDSLQKN